MPSPPRPPPAGMSNRGDVAVAVVDLYKTLFSFSLTLSILLSTIPRWTSIASSNPLRKNHNTPSRITRVTRTVSSSRFCSVDFPSSSSFLAVAPPPLAHRQRNVSVDPYFLRKSVDWVSWRRDSAEARFVIEVERSRRRRAVEESMESRWVSVKCCCCCG